MTETFDLVTADDVRLSARRWEPSGHPRATVVLVHGFAASSAEEKVVAVAEHLAATGITVVAYDAWGHGASEGEATLGDLERLDVAAAVDAAHGVETGTGDRGPVVLVGASVGAIAALRYAAGTPGRVTGIVTVSCPAHWRLPRNSRGLASALMTHTPPGRWAARRYVGVRIARPAPRPAPPVDLVGAVGVPLTIVHGGADPFIPVADAEALAAAARDPYRLEVVAGMGHAYEAPSIEPIGRAIDEILDLRP